MDPQSSGRHVALTVSLTGAADVQAVRRCLRAEEVTRTGVAGRVLTLWRDDFIAAGGHSLEVAVPAVAITRASDAALDVDALLDQVERLSGEEIERLLRSGG
jgi:hypothetical protein